MAFRLAQYKAMEECSKYGQFSTLPAPANNPFTTLPGDASNPWMNVPQPVGSRRSPLSKLFNRGSNSNPEQGIGLRGSLSVSLSSRLPLLPAVVAVVVAKAVVAVVAGVGVGSVAVGKVTVADGPVAVGPVEQ